MVNEWCFKRLKGWLSANCHVWAQGREVKGKKLSLTRGSHDKSRTDYRHKGYLTSLFYGILVSLLYLIVNRLVISNIIYPFSLGFHCGV